MLIEYGAFFLSLFTGLLHEKIQEQRRNLRADDSRALRNPLERGRAEARA